MQKQKEQTKEKKISSPYTIEEKKKSKIIPIIFTLIILLLKILIGYVLITEYINPNKDELSGITYLES